MVTALVVCFSSVAFGNVANYTFSQSNNTFNSIAGVGTGAGFGTGWDDGVSGLIDMNFSFTYNGVSYTQCYINTNGAVEFTDPTANRFQPFLQNSVANSIIVMGEDLQDNVTPGSDILYTTTGTAPNRVFIVEWSHARRFFASNEDLNMQVRLYEGSNKCEIMYGSMTWGTNTNTCQVGLSGNLPNPITDFNIRTTTNDWTATTAGVTNSDNMPTSSSIVLPSGLTYDWILQACTGTPVAGTLNASKTNGCVAYTSYLNFVTPPPGSGITYQWQSSANGTNWTNMSGATNSLDTVFVTAPIYIRAYVTCTNSNSSDTTAGILLNLVPEVMGTAVLPYFQGFESWVGTCTAADRPDTNWVNTPNTGNNSWRRDDQGADANWTDVGFGDYFPTSTEGAHSAKFHSFFAPYGSIGDLDLHIDLSTAGTKNLSFDYINEDGDDYLTVMLSEDNGATFTTLGTYYTSSNWALQNITTTSVAPNAILRFEAFSDFGGSDIGVDSLNIYVLPACSGAPVAGTISASDTAGCVAYISNLAFNTPTYATGISYQWQSSTNGVNWTNILGANNPQYQINVSATTYVRAYITCANSGLGDTTNVQILHLDPEVATAATLPYFQGFENWTGICYTYDRPDTNWLNTPNTGNNSWRRDDQGYDANWTSAGFGSYSPASTEGSHSARFHSYYSYSGEIGDLDVHVNLSSAGPKNIDFDYINEDGSDYLTVMLSEDGGVTFTTLGTLYTSSTWAPQSFSTTSTVADAIIRFEGYSDFGNSDIGIDSLNIYIPCAPPTNIAMTGGSATGADFSWTGVPGALGYMYTADQNAGTPAAGGTYTATTTAVVSGLTPATSYYFHVRTICSAGDTSNWVPFAFATIDTCFMATNLIATNITMNSADVSWDAVTGAAGYRYVLDQTATAPTVPGTFTVATSYAATGLTMNTTYYFHLRTECSNSDSSSWETIPINLLPNGVNNVTGNNFGVMVNPNPTNGLMTVTLNGTAGNNGTITVTDEVGRTIISSLKTTGIKTQIDISNLAPGVYFVKYNDSDHQQSIKVLKQ
jgi:hypothetical protein